MKKAPKEKTNRPATLRACIDLYESCADLIVSHDRVHISTGNDKIGAMLNVSTAPIVTCRGCCAECGPHCYAVTKFLRLGKNPDNAWLINTLIAEREPERFFDEISAACWPARFFRWHVAGEIINDGYFAGMVRVAQENPHCRFWAPTKQYEIVNRYMDTHGGRQAIPGNLQVAYSNWRGRPCPNPYNLPEVHVRYEHGEQTFESYPAGCRYECPGDCSTCNKARAGCWFMADGCCTIINEH